MKKPKKVRRQRTKAGEIPQILHHKPNNSAFILIEQRRYYLGKYGSVEAEEARLRVWNEYLTHRETDPGESYDKTITVSTLVNRFLDDAEKIYRKHGRSTGSYERFLVVVRPLAALYADCPIEKFTPLCLKAVRTKMISSKFCRKTINSRVNQIRQIFRWGVENELVPETIWRALTAVSPLKEGKTTAPDHPDVEPVPDEVIDKTLPLMPPAIADMVNIQRMVGMRPSEVCKPKRTLFAGKVVVLNDFRRAIP